MGSMLVDRKVMETADEVKPWLILIGNCPPLVGIQTVFRGNTAASNRTFGKPF